MIEKILFVGAWVFVVIGALATVLGIWLQADYNGSLEEQMDAFRGIRKSYRHVTKFGLLAFIISAIILIANYS